MSRFELTIDPNYIPHWTVQDGLRELLQNALDESTIHPNNSMKVTRDGTNLFISTKNAKLTKQTLLIGSSSKRDNSSTIGKEGEGYKLACLVLTRAGHKVIIHNYSQRERWIPKIINSRRYDSKLLVVDTEKFRWTSPPNYDLTFEVKGITDSIYEEMTKRTLFLRDTLLDTLSYSEVGEVLLDEEESGRVYVNGLYVSTVKDSIKYGYNLKPNRIQLDRDRRAVSDFNLTWETSSLWSNFASEKKFKELINEGNKDVQYISSHLYTGKDLIFDEFQEDYGNNAIPVVDQDAYDHVKKTYKNIKPIIVNKVKNELIRSSNSYIRTSASFLLNTEDKTPNQLLEEFKHKFKNSFSNEMIEDFNILINKSEEWK